MVVVAIKVAFIGIILRFNGANGQFDSHTTLHAMKAEYRSLQYRIQDPEYSTNA